MDIYMNRIRKYNNSYQVLLSPHQRYNVGFEFLLGSWTDTGLMGFEVQTVDTYNEAENIASNYPDLNWEQLVLYHKDFYTFIKKEIISVIISSNITVNIEYTLLSPQETKDILFNRVINGQIGADNIYRLVYNMNDIISIVITNPWSSNLIELERHLVKHTRLNLFSKLQKNGIIHLIGRTDIGTTYEIILLPNLINHWINWKNKNTNHTSSLKNILNTQKLIDNSPRLR
jgi:hypothetical protein